MSLFSPRHGNGTLQAPLTGYDLATRTSGARVGLDDVPSSGPPLFLGTERAAAADAQLQRDARVESLQQRWAEVAAALFSWLQEATLLLSERWPAVDGVRLDVTTVGDVVLYDARTLPPYGSALSADDARLRAKAQRFSAQLAQLGEALAADGAGAGGGGGEGSPGRGSGPTANGGPGGAWRSNRFSFWTPDRVAQALGELEEAIGERSAAFATEADRVTAAHGAHLEFSSAAGEFSERLGETAASLAAANGELEDVLATCRDVWAGGEPLAAMWARVVALDAACAAAGVVGTRLTLARLHGADGSGYAAVASRATSYIGQLEAELALKTEFWGRARALSAWLEGWKGPFDAAAPLPATLPAAEAAWLRLRAFLAHDRPPRARELGALIELRSACSATLSLHGRPGFSPLGFDELEADWSALDAAVSTRAAALAAELRRQRAVCDAVARFTGDALELMDWLRGRAAFLATALAQQPATKNEARAVKALVAGYAAEWAERAADLAALRALGTRIVAHRYEQRDKICALFDKVRRNSLFWSCGSLMSIF